MASFESMTPHDAYYHERFDDSAYAHASSHKVWHGSPYEDERYMSNLFNAHIQDDRWHFVGPVMNEEDIMEQVSLGIALARGEN